MKMTKEEKQTRLEARRIARKETKSLETIQSEKKQKHVKSITINIEWKRSKTWGNNPSATAEVSFYDGSFERRDGYTCSGCGYDKESTVIAEIFNDFLKYKLYQKHNWKDHLNNKETNHPYGVYYYNGNAGKRYKSGYISTPTFNDGVGTSCYYDISEFIGGKFEKVASGNIFDVYKYTDIN